MWPPWGASAQKDGGGDGAAAAMPLESALYILSSPRWQHGGHSSPVADSHRPVKIRTARSKIAGTCCGVVVLLVGLPVFLLGGLPPMPCNCEEAHCNKNGACKTNSDGSFRMCNCDPGWVGHGCEHPVGCDSEPCGAHGTCTANGSSYTCTCGGTWRGDHCGIKCGDTCNTCSRNTSTIRYGSGTFCHCCKTMPAAFELLGTSHAAYSGTYTWTPEHVCNGSPVYQLGGSGGPVRFVLAWIYALPDRMCRAI